MNIYFSYYIDHGMWEGKILKKRFPRPPEDIKYSWIYQAIPLIRATNPKCKIKIITDDYGADSIKRLNLDRDAILIELNNLNNEYGENIHDLGKIYSLKYIAEQKHPFIYFDHTFRCGKSLEEIINKEIVLESVAYEPDLKIKTFNEICKNKHGFEGIIPNRVYNSGIIGGKNYNFYLDFTTEVLKVIKDPKNKCFWLKNTLKPNERSEIALTYLLSIFIEKNNIEPYIVFNNKVDGISSFKKDSKACNYDSMMRVWLDTGFHNPIWYGATILGASKQNALFYEKVNLFQYKNGRLPNKFEKWLIRHFV